MIKVCYATHFFVDLRKFIDTKDDLTAHTQHYHRRSMHLDVKQLKVMFRCKIEQNCIACRRILDIVNK